MKKIFYVFLISIFALSLSAEWIEVNSLNPSGIEPVIVGQSDISTTVKVDMPGFNAGKQRIGFEDYSVFGIPEASVILEEGMPQLPKDAFSLIIPDEGEMSMRITDIEYIYMDIVKVLPSKGNLKRNINPDDVPYTFGDIYSDNAYYPKNTADLSDEFIIRDFRGITVTLYPLQYNPAEGKLRIVKSITIEVYRSDSGGKNILNRTKRAKDAGFDEIYSNFFINYDYMSQSKYPFLSDAAGNMLIVSASGYMDNLSEWIYWKQKKGIDVELVNVSTIGNNSTDIKNYIQNKYDNEGVTWVVLVGNGTDVATISGSYDNTCDPVYSYLAGADNYPDCYIARVSGNSETNIDLQMEKFIDYERYPQDGAHWYHRACGTATTEGSPTDEERLTWVNDTLLSYTYTSASHIGESWADNNDVLDSLSNGNSILNHIGHGNQTGFGTSSAFWITTSDIAGLTNTDMLTFAYMCACQIGDFDGVTTCLTESWMWAGALGAPTGGIGIYGSSVNQSWIPPTNAQLHANGLLKREETTTMGGMAYNGAMYMLEVDGDLEMLETWHIFGDPSIDLYTDTPDTLEVTHDEFIATGPTSFVVDVKDNDGITPINSALVCLWGQQDTTIHEIGYTSSGTVSIPVNATNAGDTIFLTVTKHNYKPYETYIVVGVGIPSKPQQISYYDHARVPETSPILKFVSTDEDGDDVIYKIYLDTDQNFSSPDSFITGSYTEGVTASYTLPVTLTDNETYHWKVRTCDPSGSAFWSGWSPVRTFTIGTALGNDNCSWYQTTSEQYECCTINNLRISGDSLLLNPSYAGSDTLLNADFESSMPAGWSATGSSTRAVWTTGTGSSYAPPSYGTAYAVIQYPTSGPNPPGDTDILTAPKCALTTGTTVLNLSYGYGFDNGISDEMTCEVRFFSSIWGAWTELASYTADGSGSESFDLSSYLPADSVQVRWSFISTGGKNGQDGAVDNVMLIGDYDVVSNYGYILTPQILYSELNNTYARSSWGNVNWQQSSENDSILFHIEYCDNNTWNLIPEGDLPGNAAGIGGVNTSGYGNHSLASINPAIYDSIRIKFELFRKMTKSSTEPSLYAIEVGNLLSSMTGVKDINLRACIIGNAVQLKWNSNTYTKGICIIERSDDNEHYKVIASVNSDIENSTFLDTDPGKGSLYYRLKIIENDGSEIMFGPVKLFRKDNTNGFMLSSNTLLKSNIGLEFSISVQSDVCFTITDITGRTVKTILLKNVEAGSYNTDINTAALMQGTYFIRMQTNTYSQTEKLINIK